MKENLTKIIANSRSYKDVLLALGKRSAGGNYKTLQKYIRQYDISVIHFDTPSQRCLQSNKAGILTQVFSLSEILVENSTYSRTNLKSRLYKEGLKKPICELCGQNEIWQGKHMSLILDHINGVWNDNRLENLQIVCPNCNATLNTFAGRNLKKSKVSVSRPQKISWPSDDELKQLVWSSSMVKLSKTLGVSDRAIRKHCIKHGISLPPAGFWAKKETNPQY